MPIRVIHDETPKIKRKTIHTHFFVEEEKRWHWNCKYKGY